MRTAAVGSATVPREEPIERPENRTQLFELLAKTLTRLAGGQPLVLVLEDLHEADASIEALQYIVRRLGPTPTLIVGTYRSGEVDRAHPLTRMLDGFRGGRRFAAVELGPLTRDEHRNLVQSLLGGSAVSEELVEQLYVRGEGNPFLTMELVRSLLDGGTIIQDESGAWTMAMGLEIGTSQLPATIQQAVQKRIGRLEEQPRRILSVASVIGRSFDYRDLRALVGEGDELDDAVDELVRQGLLDEDRRKRGDSLSFASGALRDVLYSDLSRRRRRSLHRSHADQLERRHAGRLERVFPQLVYHFAEGDVPEKAVEYGLLYARKSLDTFNPHDAIRRCQDGAGLPGRGVGGRALPRRRRSHDAVVGLPHGGRQPGGPPGDRGGAAQLRAL